ncbi:MAG TPA: urease accessory UreF family protein [Bryobacteraceae bacterium]
MQILPDETSLLRLLQLADSALPVGGSAHSYGLETLAQEGSLAPENLEDFLGDYLEETGALDAAFVRRAWKRGDLRALSAEYGARKPARESREASLKLGRRLAGLVNAVFSAPVFEPGPTGDAFGGRTLVRAGLESRSGSEAEASRGLKPALHAALHYCIVFGAVGALFGASQDATALGFLHQSIAGLVSACQRLMPLGQSAAARILWNLKPAIVHAARCEEVWCFSPYPELASMRHGSLGTRLFIS